MIHSHNMKDAKRVKNNANFFPAQENFTGGAQGRAEDTLPVISGHETPCEIPSARRLSE